MKFSLFGFDFEINKKEKPSSDIKELFDSIKEEESTGFKLSEEHHSKKTGYSSRLWSKEDIEKLREMKSRNLTYVGMARMLGRTEPAIRSALRRFDIK